MPDKIEVNMLFKVCSRQIHRQTTSDTMVILFAKNISIHGLLLSLLLLFYVNISLIM